MIAEQIALLIAVPITIEEFTTRVENSDWLAKFKEPYLTSQQRRAALEARWRTEYAAGVAQPLSQLVDTARSFHVEVQTAATLDMLRQALATHSIVVLFAHWKGAEVVLDDLVSDGARSADAFAERVEEGVDPLLAFLRARLTSIRVGEPPSSWFRWLRGEPPRQSIGDVMNETLSEPDLDVVHAHSDIVMESAVTLAARRRDRLNEIFAGLLRPGNRLELFDGLHAKEDVAAIVPKSFDGVLDLTTCSSTVLADFLSASTKRRLRTVQFPEVQLPLWAAKCIETTFRIVRDHNISYQKARALASSLMTQAVVENESSSR